MTTQKNTANLTIEQERKDEGGRKFGHVQEPSQAQQASRNKGLANNPPVNRPSHRNQGNIIIRHTYDQGQNQAEDMRRQSQEDGQSQQKNALQGERKTA